MESTAWRLKYDLFEPCHTPRFLASPLPSCVHPLPCTHHRMTQPSGPSFPWDTLFGTGAPVAFFLLLSASTPSHRNSTAREMGHPSLFLGPCASLTPRRCSLVSKSKGNGNDVFSQATKAINETGTLNTTQEHKTPSDRVQLTFVPCLVEQVVAVVALPRPSQRILKPMYLSAQLHSHWYTRPGLGPSALPLPHADQLWLLPFHTYMPLTRMPGHICQLLVYFASPRLKHSVASTPLRGTLGSTAGDRLRLSAGWHIQEWTCLVRYSFFPTSALPCPCHASRAYPGCSALAPLSSTTTF